MYKDQIKQVERIEKAMEQLAATLTSDKDMILLNNARITIAHLGLAFCRQQIKQLAHISPELTHQTER